MGFYEELTANTAVERDWLLAAPVIRRALAGEITLDHYLDFLAQAYHHVRHTVPLMMAVGARLGDRHDWLQADVLHYLEEEAGHEQWILNDVAAAGSGFGSDTNQVALVDPQGRVDQWPLLTKREVARRLCDYLADQLGEPVKD